VAAAHAQDLRAQHRGQTERNEGGNHDRAGHRDPELVEQPPGGPLEERKGREHGDQRHGRRDHGEGDLSRPVQRRRRRVLPQLILVPERVLHHDDRVIHHDPDGQDQREQRQVVDREPEYVHEPERSHDRGGDGEPRNQRPAQVPEEDEYDEHHQDPGQDQRVFRLADRSSNELRAIKGEVQLDTGR
jgi:hypothetical protein